MGWRQRQSRQPEGNIKLIPILQFLVLSFKKPTACICVSGSRAQKSTSEAQRSRKPAISTKQALTQWPGLV